MFTYFKAAEYVASSFLFLLLLSGSLSVSEGCLSATDDLHKTLILIWRDHMGNSDFGQQPDNFFSSGCPEHPLYPPSFLFSISFAPETQKLVKERVFWDQVTLCAQTFFLRTAGSSPAPVAFPRSTCHGLLPTDHSLILQKEIFPHGKHLCRPFTGRWEHFSKLPGRGNTDSCQWKETQGGLTKSSVETGLI